jgi:hypothetical protein
LDPSLLCADDGTTLVQTPLTALGQIRQFRLGVLWKLTRNRRPSNLMKPSDYFSLRAPTEEEQAKNKNNSKGGQEQGEGEGESGEKFRHHRSKYLDPFRWTMTVTGLLLSSSSLFFPILVLSSFILSFLPSFLLSSFLLILLRLSGASGSPYEGRSFRVEMEAGYNGKFSATILDPIFHAGVE